MTTLHLPTSTPAAIIFIGVQAAGKSTFYRQRFFNTHVRINLDMLRTRHREKLLLHACIEMKQPFVVDNTNVTVADRTRYIEPSLRAGFRVVCYYFYPDAAGSLMRNSLRAEVERVPVGAIYGTAKRLEPPTWEESFAAIHGVRVEAGGFVVEEWVREV